MNNNVFVPFSDVSMPERPFDEIPEPIMDAMRKVNRNLNYKVRPRSIIVYGESGSGKTFMLNQLAYHINEFNGSNVHRMVKFIGVDYVNRIMTGDGSLTAFGLQAAAAINETNTDRHLIIVVPDLHLFLLLIAKCRNTSFILEADDDMLSHAMTNHSSQVDKIEAVQVNNKMKWKEFLNEAHRANITLAGQYGVKPVSNVAMKAFIEELIRQVYPTHPESFRSIEEIEIPIGYVLERIEYMYAWLMESEGKPINAKTARTIAREAFNDSPIIDEDDFDDDDMIMSMLNDELHNKKDKKQKPAKTLKYNDPLHLADRLKTTVINQDKAIDMVSKAILIDAAGMKPKDKPVASFLFLGPSGVGKTQLAKSLADTLFEKPVNLVRIDCSEFNDKHTAARLFGAPPGYVGYDNGGELTNAVREHPQSLVLLDEVEKAHPDIWNTFLQVFDDARLTDGQGETTDFSHCIFILTGNLGTKEAENMKTAGFGESTVNDEETVYMKAMRDFFRPEFINRLDGICVFNKLRREDYARIVRIKLHEISGIIKDNYGKTVDFNVSDAAMDGILIKARSMNLGAREIDHVLKSNIVLPMAEKILSRDIALENDKHIRIDDSDGDLMLEIAQ